MRGLGLDVQGTVKSARLVEPLRRGGPGPRRWLDTMHRSARRRLDRIATNGSPTRAVLGAMLLGDRAALPAETARALRGAGLAHLLAISGLHVGLIVFGLFSLLRRWGSTGWTSVILACTGLSGFGMFVGGRPSVARAVAAAAALLLGRRLGREGDALNTIALVAAGLALSRPAVLWNLGYQLSFLATAGILCSSAALSRALPLPGPLGAGIAVSLSAYLATGPVVAASFGGLAPAGILINLISLPLCAVILASGYAAILLQELPGAGAWLGWCSSGAVDLLLDVGRNAGRVGWHGVHPPSAWLILGYYTSALLLIVEHRGARQNQRARQALLALFAVATVWLHVGDLPPSAPAEIEAHVLDVGQGQAVAIRGPSGAWFVVDAGGSGPGRFDPGERIVLPALRRAGARRLAALIVTHEDADHAGGAFALLRELEVGQLWMGPGWHREPRMRALAELALERGASLRQVERGESSMLAGLPLRVLAPGREQLAWDSNDRSLVLSIGTAPARLLIPGDLETAGERGLLADGSPLSADVLIVPHHGSRNGSSAAFLDRVAAGHAVVSCGRRNNFGHPHPEVVERLRARGTRLWRTDRQGRIRIRGGPGGLRIDGYIAPPGTVTR